MATAKPAPPADEPKGLRRMATGAHVGLAAGVIGLAIPLVVIFYTSDQQGGVLQFRPELIEATALLALTGAILFFVSLLLYRMGFWALRQYDRRFWIPSILCLLGTVGFLLLIVAALLAITTSDTMVACIQGAPTHALSCLQSASPVAGWSGIVGYWLAWLGGLGIVIGLILAGQRYHQNALYAGTGMYAILLLILVPSFVGVVLQVGSLSYPLLLAPVLILLAPGLVSDGCRRALGR